MILKFWSSCLCLPSTRIIGRYHYVYKFIWNFIALIYSYFHSYGTEHFQSHKDPSCNHFLIPSCTLTYSLVLSSPPDTLSCPPYIKFCQFRNVFPGTYCGLFGLGARSARLGSPTSLVLILTWDLLYALKVILVSCVSVLLLTFPGWKPFNYCSVEEHLGYI